MKNVESNRTGFPAVFLDRDGVINEEVGFVNHESRFRILPGVAEGIRMLKDTGFLCIVVTNQPGVGMGVFPEDLVMKLHRRMKEILGGAGAHLDGIYYCPHHEHAVIKEYRCRCPNRKPEPGMMKMAAQDLSIDFGASYLIGDRGVDIEAAGRAGVRPVLVETGYGKGEWLYRRHTWKCHPIFIAKNLKDAARRIIAARKE
jgi:D-glycero-D-manno-heptose 1,7-bisphosphate phosphatase